MDLVNRQIENYAHNNTTPATAEIDQTTADTADSPWDEEMISGLQVGRLLETLCWVMQPELVLEIGTFTGVSALFMAGGLGPDARLVTCESQPEYAAFARERVRSDPRIEVREGPALATIDELAGPIDLVFLDADKGAYLNYLDAVLPKLADHGLIVADNTLWAGGVLDPGEDHSARALADFNRRASRDSSLSSVVLTVRDGLTLIRRRQP